MNPWGCIDRWISNLGLVDGYSGRWVIFVGNVCGAGFQSTPSAEKLSLQVVGLQV